MKPASRHHPIVSLLAAAAAVCAASAASADIVNQTASAAAGQSWATATLWDNHAAASAGNDYFTDGYTLRTPDGVNSSFTFPGASLTVDASADRTTRPRGGLSLKGSTITIANLSIGVGTVSNAAAAGSGDNRPATLNVTNLTILEVATAENPAILQGSSSGNHLAVNVTRLLGSGRLQFTHPSGVARNYSLGVADASAFLGGIHLDKGNLTLTADFSAPATFSMAASGASLVLSSNLAVSSFTFGSHDALVSGSYTSAQLNALFGTTAFSGDGIVSLQSIPEPSTLVFVFGAVALCVCGGVARAKRRRRE